MVDRGGLSRKNLSRKNLSRVREGRQTAWEWIRGRERTWSL